MWRNVLLIGFISLLLNGCSHLYGGEGLIHDPDEEYYKDEAPPPLVIPHGVQAAEIGDDYVIPEINSTKKSKAALVPPGSLAEQVALGNTTTKQIKKARDDKKATLLVVDTDMNETWNKLKYVMPKMDYQIAIANSDTRIIYFMDKTTTRGKVTLATPIYQAHLHLSEAGETEIYLTDNDGKKLPATISKPILSELEKGLQGKVKTAWARLVTEMI